MVSRAAGNDIPDALLASIIEEIARASGFASGLAINRLFKRELGVAPSRYRDGA
jgi:AraC-like DNA-binding protein